MKCGLIGEKLGHSFSKIIHERLTDSYTYSLNPLNSDEFKEFMNKKDFDAINVTIPYKISVIPYLESLDERAKAIGAVNTIVNRNGKLYGHNTDFGGFLYLLNNNNINVKGKKVVVLGKGGASKAVIAVLKHQKAGEILTVYYKPNSDTITVEDCKNLHSDSSIIINTTPVGMYPNNTKSPLDINGFKNLEAVVDIIYNPIATPIIVQAKKLGIKAIGGLEMLVAQAHEAAGIFLNSPLDYSDIDKNYRQILLARLNIVLIGMPSCGKTTIGKLLSQSLNREFYDTDEEIIKQIGMPIADYFEKFGEPSFRSIETEVIKYLSAKTGVVVSTGGGCVKNGINMENLNQNGIVVFISRPLENLLVDKARPLSASIDAISKLYHERLPLYNNYSDVKIVNDRLLTDVAEEVKLAFLKAIEKY